MTWFWSFLQAFLLKGLNLQESKQEVASSLPLKEWHTHLPSVSIPLTLIYWNKNLQVLYQDIHMSSYFLLMKIKKKCKQIWTSLIFFSIFLLPWWLWSSLFSKGNYNGGDSLCWYHATVLVFDVKDRLLNRLLGLMYYILRPHHQLYHHHHYHEWLRHIFFNL